MKSHLMLPALSLWLAALLSQGCNTQGPKSPAAQSKMTDSDLEAAVARQLSADPDLSQVRASANASKNEVTLSGTVTTQAQRTRALEAARSTHSPLTITDKIDVKPREIARSDYNEDMAKEARTRATRLGDKVGDTIDDAWLHTKITAKLIGDKDTPARHINVDVVGGVVTLRGTVDTTDAKAEAERIAKQTEGVAKVVSLLRVRRS